MCVALKRSTPEYLSWIEVVRRLLGNVFVFIFRIRSQISTISPLNRRGLTGGNVMHVPHSILCPHLDDPFFPIDKVRGPPDSLTEVKQVINVGHGVKVYPISSYIYVW